MTIAALTLFIAGLALVTLGTYRRTEARKDLRSAVNIYNAFSALPFNEGYEQGFDEGFQDAMNEVREALTHLPEMIAEGLKELEEAEAAQAEVAE